MLLVSRNLGETCGRRLVSVYWWLGYAVSAQRPKKVDAVAEKKKLEDCGNPPKHRSNKTRVAPRISPNFHPARRFTNRHCATTLSFAMTRFVISGAQILRLPLFDFTGRHPIY